MSTLRNLLVGVIAGVALSLARAPVGMELTAGPAVDALDAALFRALALFTVALGALGAQGTQGSGPRVPALLTGAAAGYALHGLLLSERVAVAGWAGLALVLALAVVAMSWAVPRERAPEPAESRGPGPTWPERLGLAIAGAGAAISLESVARVLRLFGASRPADDTAFGAAFLTAVALGAAAFGGWVAGGRRAAAALAGGLALTGAACLFSLDLLAEIGHHDALDQFVRRRPWNLDLSAIGQLQGDLLIGWRVLLVPAFALGAVLCGARDRGRWVSVGIGAAVGLVLLPLVLVDGAPISEEQAGRVASGRVATGTIAAAIGGLIALAGARRQLPRAAAIGGAVASAAALALALAGPRPAVLPLSPWERFPPQLEWVADTPEGLLTLEHQAGGEWVVTLDRLRLTPAVSEQRADEQRLRLSFCLLNSGRREGARVLLVGQLTPMRAFVLRGLGAARVDRTAAWHASMSELEARMVGDGLPEGDVLSPSEAEERARAGRYDLIVVPPVQGTSPLAAVGPGSGRTVVWLAASSDVAGRSWGDAVLLSSDGFAHLAIGVHGGDEGLPTGRPDRSASALERLLERTFVRELAAERAAVRRLDEAAGGSPYEQLAAGLRAHVEVQEQSSPWDTAAQATELSGEALALLRGALEAVEEPCVAEFTRELWGGIARVLIDKREIDLAFEHLEPLAAAHAPWHELERALAQADLEVLEPGSAARRLEKVLAANPYDLGARLTRAHALGMAGDPAAEAEELRLVLTAQPGRRDVRRRLAVALVRADDPAGAEMIEALLREEPDDEGLRAYLGQGPFPPLPIEYSPTGDTHDH